MRCTLWEPAAAPGQSPTPGRLPHFTGAPGAIAGGPGPGPSSCRGPIRPETCPTASSPTTASPDIRGDLADCDKERPLESVIRAGGARPASPSMAGSPSPSVGGGGHRSAVLGGRPRWPFPRGAAGPGASLARSLGTRPQRAQGSVGWEGTLGSRGSPSSPAAFSPPRPSSYGRTQPPRPRASRGRWNKGLRAAWCLRGAACRKLSCTRRRPSLWRRRNNRRQGTTAPPPNALRETQVPSLSTSNNVESTGGGQDGAAQQARRKARGSVLPPNWKRKQRRDTWNCAGAQPEATVKFEQGGCDRNVVSL